MASKLVIEIYVTPDGKLRRRQNFNELYSANAKVQLKRGVGVLFHVYFLDTDNLPYLLDDPAYVRVKLRSEGIFDENTGILAVATSTAQPVGSSHPYVVDMSLNTTELNTALNVDSDSTNDVVSIDTEFGVSWTEDNWTTKQENTDRVKAIVYNDVDKDTDGTPLTLPTAETWLTARAVRFDTAQTLSNAEKEQAFANLGIAAYNDLTAANAALSIGVPYYDRALERLNIATA